MMLVFLVLLVIITLPGNAAEGPEWTSSLNHRLDDGKLQQTRSAMLQDKYIYLPLITKNFPITPLAPVLDAISNQDGDGNYTITWTAVEGGKTYLLQEDDNNSFSSPTTAYEGPSTSKAISGKGVGAYYYRLMAYNPYASSGWSNIQTVMVSVTPPPCPQAGSWWGKTGQDENIVFTIENSPVCQIAAGSLKISWDITLCGSATITFNSAKPITDNKFSVSSTQVDATGEFTAFDLAKGTLTVDYMSGYTRCYYKGFWEAYPVVGTNGPAFDLLVQPDDKILVGGKFSEVGGQTHHNLARLNPDGSLDSAFTPNFNSSVFALAIQSDGKILAGGLFSHVDGEAHARIARLNPDGSLDTSFNAQIVGNVAELAIQSDGKILVGGRFSDVNGQPRDSIARLNADGTLDEAFNVTASYMDVYALEVQADDKILLGGYIEDVAGETWADYFVRLNPGGSLDTTFQPDTEGSWVDGVAIQADGKILAAIYGDLARFETNGARDDSFISPKPLAQSIRQVAIQAGGALVVGGDFWRLGGDLFEYLAQLDPNGALNSAFNPAPNGTIYTLSVQPDNKILVGGTFTQISGQVRHGLVRLNSDGTLDESFSIGT